MIKVRVTRAEVLAAQALVRRSDLSERPLPSSVRWIAEAKPETPEPDYTLTHDHCWTEGDE